MAQGKSSPPSKKPGAKPAVKSPGRPPAKKAGRSIVNQKQTPWGWIAIAAALVIFAGVIIAFVVVNHKDSSSSDPYTRPELADAAAIEGVVYKAEPNHNHVQGVVDYDTTPPTGGNHSQYWADCSGTIYSKAIANENAVHALEHGAVWITYNADKVKGADLKVLENKVAPADGSPVDRMMLSPYPDLKSAVSLQAWGYQLALDDVNDPRIDQFIQALKYNRETTPEYGASCEQTTFVDSPSTFGKPLWTPVSGSGGTMDANS